MQKLKLFFSANGAEAPRIEDKPIQYNLGKSSPPREFPSKYSSEVDSSKIITAKDLSDLFKRIRNEPRVEKKDFLNNLHDYAYYLIAPQEIANKLKNSSMFIADKISRLELWGINLHHRTDSSTVNQIIDNLPRSDFGVKNLIFLRYLVENINSNELSNLELINPPNKILEYQERLIRFQNSLDELPRLVLPKRKI